MDDRESMRRRLRYRSWHRGCRESDLLLGPFADAFLPEATGDGLEAYEELLETDDVVLWDWLTGRIQPPEHWIRHPLWLRLMAFLAGRASG